MESRRLGLGLGANAGGRRGDGCASLGLEVGRGPVRDIAGRHAWLAVMKDIPQSRPVSPMLPGQLQGQCKLERLQGVPVAPHDLLGPSAKVERSGLLQSAPQGPN